MNGTIEPFFYGDNVFFPYDDPRCFKELIPLAVVADGEVVVDDSFVLSRKDRIDVFSCVFHEWSMEVGCCCRLHCEAGIERWKVGEEEGVGIVGM